LQSKYFKNVSLWLIIKIFNDQPACSCSIIEKMDNKISSSRQNFEKLGTLYKKADNVTIEKEIIENVICYWFNKTNTETKNKIIIYLHGGCFVLGSINSHQALVSHFADKLDIPVLFIEYSLAPENPFPAAINEILKVYQFVLLKKEIHHIVFMGDSAGAGLSMSVISMLNRKNIAGPDGLVMISPWMDLSVSSDSISGNAAIDPILTKEQLIAYTRLYLGDNKLSVANPIETLFGKFPPTLILAGSSEILLDDSHMAYSAISVSQPIVKSKIYESQTHVWLLDNINTEASKDAIEEIKNFIGS
jgi:epsilon-lactone hydrolase